MQYIQCFQFHRWDEKETQNTNQGSKMGVKIRRKGEKRHSICNYYRKIHFSIFCYLLPNYIKSAGLWRIMQMDQLFLHAHEFELSTWSVMGKAFQRLVDCMQTRAGLSKMVGPLLGKGSWLLSAFPEPGTRRRCSPLPCCA